MTTEQDDGDAGRGWREGVDPRRYWPLDQGLQCRADSADTEAMARCVGDGDPGAENAIFHAHFRGLTRPANRRGRDAARMEDIRQDALIVALSRLRRRTLSEPAKLPNFVNGTLKKLRIADDRREGRRLKILRKNLPELADDGSDRSAVETLIGEEQAATIRTLLEQLPVERDREILRRVYLLEQEKHEICAALALTPEHYDRVLSRARQRFRRLVALRAPELADAYTVRRMRRPEVGPRLTISVSSRAGGSDGKGCTSS